MSQDTQKKIKAATVRFPAQTFISEEGDRSDAWYLLMSGRVGVFKGDHQIAEFDKRGAVFGEISSILRQPRSATLIALDDCEIVTLEATLDQLIAEHPDIAKKIIVNLAERLVKTTDALWMAMDPEAAKQAADKRR